MHHRQVNSPFDYSISLLQSPRDWDAPELRSRWEELVKSSGNVNAMYASPTWFDYLRETHDESNLLVAVVRTASDEIAGIVPVQFGPFNLRYDISSRALFSSQLTSAFVLGSLPTLPDSHALQSKLYEALLDSRASCDAVYLDTVPVDSASWQFVTGSDVNGHLIYIPYKERVWHLLQLGACADEYFSRMSSKTRNTLRKKVKKLREHGGGRLEVIRAERVDDVDRFLAGAAEVSRSTWQHKVLGPRVSSSAEERSKFASLARRGLLRSYLLTCGDRPCAFVIGHQYDGVFHYNELGYDPELSSLSPGTVLLYMLIQDLFEHRSPTLLNFGMGDADYKQRFGNVRKEDASVFVLRKTLRNQVRIHSHSAFRSTVSTVRSIVNRYRRA